MAFNESEVLRAFSPSANAGGTIKVWYNDEHALLLGVRQVQVINPNSTTNYTVSPLCGTPAAGCSAIPPQVGTTAQNGDQAGTDTSSCAGSPDLCDRPIWPSLFLTDITGNPSSKAGDWQSGGTPITPDAVFGTWKAAVRVVNHTNNTVMVNPDNDPTKNHFNLDGGDAPPAGLTDQGYGAETRWNVNALGLTVGHSYRIQVMVHDGDQNKSGGDAGEACATFCFTGQPGPPEIANAKDIRLVLAVGAGGDQLSSLKLLLWQSFAGLGLPGQDLTLILDGAAGEFFRATIPAAQLVANPSGTSIRFRDPTGLVAGGIKKLTLRNTKSGTSISLRGGNLTLTGMAVGPFTATLNVGGNSYGASGRLRVAGTKLMFP